MPTLDADHPLLDPEALKERRQLHELDGKDLIWAKRLHGLIQPASQALADTFYQRLFAHPPLARFVQDERTRHRLKQTFQHYLDTLGRDFESQEYARQRLQVGLRHAEIGLPLTYYLCAHATLQETLIEHIFATAPHAPQSLIRFVIKITAFDTALAVEAYHLIRTGRLEESIADLREEKDRLTVAATTDALTHLANRRHMLEILQRLIDHTDRQKHPLCLAILDLDDFKIINDRRGHLCGDRVLSHVGKLLREGLRGADVVGRYGGEEFMLVLCDADLPQARKVLERLRYQVEKDPTHCGGEEISITFSAGVALHRPGEDLRILIERADQALYRAKEKGKNRVEEAPDSATRRAAEAANNSPDLSGPG